MTMSSICPVCKNSGRLSPDLAAVRVGDSPACPYCGRTLAISLERVAPDSSLPSALPRRAPPLQFSLRTMLVVMTSLCVFFAVSAAWGAAGAGVFFAVTAIAGTCYCRKWLEALGTTSVALIIAAIAIANRPPD